MKRTYKTNSVYQGGTKIVLASLAAAMLTFGTTAFATYDSATNTDTLTNQMVSPTRGDLNKGDLHSYDHADRNLVINWNNTSRGDGAPIRAATVNAKNITITADFDDGYGIMNKGINSSEGNSHVTASGNIKITTRNDSVYTESNGSTIIDGFKNLTIKATGNDWLGSGGFGVVDNGGGITIQGGNDSKVDISTVTSVQAAVGNSVRYNTVGTGVTISANEIKLYAPKLGVYAAAGKNGNFTVNLDAPTVTINGAVEANGGNVSINPDTNGTVTITKGTFQGSWFSHAVPYSILATGNTGKVAINQNQGGQVLITGDIAATSGGTVSIQGTKEDSLILGNLKASQRGTLDLKLTGSQSTLQGNLANTDSTSSVTLGNASTWIGDLTSTSGTAAVNLDGSHWDGSSTGNGDITLTNGSLWALTKDSTANSVNPDGSSIVSLAGAAKKLDTKKLGGTGGTFLMDLSYHNNDVNTYRNGGSDFVVAHDGNGSTYNVSLTSGSSVNGMTDGSKLYFASTAASTAADSSTFRMNQSVQVANYNKIYNKNLIVKKETENSDSKYKGFDDWFLTPDSSKGNGGDTINPNGIVPGSVANAAFALWRDDDTLLKRLGELRYNQQDDGIWARLVNKHLERDGRHGFKGNYKTIQVGYDKKKDTADNSSWYYGGAVSHLWGDTDYTDGYGKQKETDLSLYGTNIRPHGHYLDLIARVGRIDSDYTTSYGDHGEFENWGMSIGAEYGRKKVLGSGWSLEPQAQLTYHYLWGDDYTTSNGAKVSQDNADSLVGRLGFVLGKEFKVGTPHAGRVYLKASVLHDFLGDTDSRITDDLTYHDDDDLGDTWYVAGVGTDVYLGSNTRFYFDAERNFNADVKMKYRFNAGLRFGF